MDADPPRDPCQRATKQFTALLFNLESERLQNGCGVGLSAEGCTSTSLGDLLDELATLILDGDCQRAADCAAAVNEGTAVVESLDSPGEVASASDGPEPIASATGSARFGKPTIDTPKGPDDAAHPPVEAAEPAPTPLVAWDAETPNAADPEPSAPLDEDPLEAVQRHLAVVANASAAEETRAVSTDALLTALSGGYEPEVLIQIVKGLLGRVDVAYESLLAEHLRDIRDEAADFGKEDLAKEAERLLKRIANDEE